MLRMTSTPCHAEERSDEAAVLTGGEFAPKRKMEKAEKDDKKAGPMFFSHGARLSL